MSFWKLYYENVNMMQMVFFSLSKPTFHEVEVLIFLKETDLWSAAYQYFWQVFDQYLCLRVEVYFTVLLWISVAVLVYFLEFCAWGLFEGGSYLLLLKFISSKVLYNINDSFLPSFVSSLTIKSKRSFYIIDYSFWTSTSIFYVTVVSGWHLLKNFAADDAALIRGA